MTQSPAAQVGAYVPPRIARPEHRPLDAGLVDALAAVTGLSSAVSDELDRLGIRTAVPASVAQPLRPDDVVVGRAVTLRYVPTRRYEEGDGRLAHLTLFDLVEAGDVAVIEAPPGIPASVLGGRAAAAGVRAGLAGLIAFGAIRDVDEILATGLRTWAMSRTPVTGRGRIEAVEINGPLGVAGVQVVPGDIVVADGSGIVFVPEELFEEVGRRILGG